MHCVGIFHENILHEFSSLAGYEDIFIIMRNETIFTVFMLNEIFEFFCRFLHVKAFESGSKIILLREVIVSVSRNFSMRVFLYIRKNLFGFWDFILENP